MKSIEYNPIGVIHTPFHKQEGTPIQTPGGRDIEGTIEILPEFVEGLVDLDGFSHIILIYHFHLSRSCDTLKIKPFMDDTERGLFSTRAPVRPNSVGISVVRLIRMKGNILYIKDMDIIDGTPLIDIKPYVPKMDVHEVEKIGWLEKNIFKMKKASDDGRFKE